MTDERKRRIREDSEDLPWAMKLSKFKAGFEDWKNHEFSLALVNYEMPTNYQRNSIRLADVGLKSRRETRYLNFRIVGRDHM